MGGGRVEEGGGRYAALCNVEKSYFSKYTYVCYLSVYTYTIDHYTDMKQSV